jgi:hypothetical protein
MSHVGLSDLDRCRHGRHSGKVCVSCPGGVSEGNLLLFSGVKFEPGVPVRIGTTARGEPIEVIPVRSRENSDEAAPQASRKVVKGIA